VHKWFGEFHALRGIDMEVKVGEVIVIFGPSGSGKSTFIRTINRLEEHNRGQIIVDGIELTQDVSNIEKIREETGMVFQLFNLFPHLTVLQNITLSPIQVKNWSKEKAVKKAEELLERVGIPEQAYKFPGQLSGGQQQRVAIARALARISNNAPLVAISTFYISLIRGTPLYLQVIFFFLALPQMGIYLSGFYAGVIALGLNYGAYMSEIFRAGILSVSKGQHEAATALGMNSRQRMLYIVLPQALRLAIPPMGNEYIAMLKDSSLVSVTGFVHEILWRAQKVGRQKFKNLEALLVAAFFYWMLTLLFTALQARLEKRVGQGEGEIKTISH